MQVTLNPVLTDLERIRLGSWLVATLENERLLNRNTVFPLNGHLCIYQDSKPMRLVSGVWQVSDYSHEIHLAGGVDIVDPPLRERLSILLVLSQLCEQSVELVDACSTAITRYLLGEHRELSSSLVSASVPVDGIAFSSDRIASLLDGVWMLPSGETVDVSGPEWTVCATGVPVVNAPVVDVNFNARNFGPAFPPVETLNPVSIMIGEQLIYESPTPLGDQVVTVVQVDIDDTVHFTFDDGSASSAPVTEFRRPVPGELAALTTPQFIVGQRVHWTPNAREDAEHECDATVVSFDAPYYIIQEADTTQWTAEPSELRVL